MHRAERLRIDGLDKASWWSLCALWLGLRLFQHPASGSEIQKVNLKPGFNAHLPPTFTSRKLYSGKNFLTLFPASTIMPPFLRLVLAFRFVGFISARFCVVAAQ